MKKYFWICPNCHSKVDALKQLTDACFDEDGEAEFSVEKGNGLLFHTIFCPNCRAQWFMSISGMNLD